MKHIHFLSDEGSSSEWDTCDELLTFYSTSARSKTFNFHGALCDKLRDRFEESTACRVTSASTPLFFTLNWDLSFAADRLKRERQRSAEIAVEQFYRATEELKPAQRARLNNVFSSWEQFRPVEPLQLGNRFADWFQQRDPWPNSPALQNCFETYLDRAHEAPAVARKEAKGRRLWFEQWRRRAFQALRHGLAPGLVAAIVRSAPVAPRRSNDLRPDKGSAATFHGLRDRLAHAIFPNAPSVGHLRRDPAIGGGSLVLSG